MTGRTLTAYRNASIQINVRENSQNRMKQRTLLLDPVGPELKGSNPNSSVYTIRTVTIVQREWDPSVVIRT
jgi:hypothetical protein